MEMLHEFFAGPLQAIAMAFDFPILDWIQATLKCGFLDVVMPIITMFGDGGIFWILCSLIFLCLPKHRRTGLAMILSLIMGVILCNVLLKNIVGRIRPYDLKDQLGVTIPLLTERMHDFSFPSGHTIASFEASVALLLNNKKLGIPAVILAILIAMSRLYLYVHYPTDVITSVFLGIGLAFLANHLVKKLPEKHGRFEAAA